MRIALSPLAKKQLSAIAMFFWCYFSLCIIAILLGCTGGLVAQELGLVYVWAERRTLGAALSLFLAALAVAAGYGYLMWRLRRTVLLTLTMVYYGAKALLVGVCGYIASHRWIAAALASAVILLLVLGPRYPTARQSRLLRAATWATLGSGLVLVGALASRALLKKLNIVDVHKEVRNALAKGYWIPDDSCVAALPRKEKRHDDRT